MNDVGEGPWSLVSCFRTKPAVPQAPHCFLGTAVSSSVRLFSRPSRPLFLSPAVGC